MKRVISAVVVLMGPYVMIGCNVIVADTEDEARRLRPVAGPLIVRRLSRRVAGL